MVMTLIKRQHVFTKNKMNVDDIDEQYQNGNSMTITNMVLTIAKTFNIHIKKTNMTMM